MIPIKCLFRAIKGKTETEMFERVTTFIFVVLPFDLARRRSQLVEIGGEDTRDEL